MLGVYNIRASAAVQEDSVPTFELMPVDQAIMKSATGKRAQITREYLGYIEQLKAGQAGRLEGGEGESVSAIRRRLGAAAKAAGKNLVIKRAGNEIYFWVRGQESGGPRKRGRPRKVTTL